MTQLIKGYYHDILTGPQGQIQWDSGWRPNLIVQQCHRLLAALMKGHQGMRGVLFWAVGEGQERWDSLSPSPVPTDFQLCNEIARQALATEQIVYLAEEPTTTISDQLEIGAEFTSEDFGAHGVQTLREFGLFGGDATDTPNSGFMIDYVIHPRIDLRPDMTLKRTLRLNFQAGLSQQEEWVGVGDALPVVNIDGVGNQYAKALSRAEIRTLADLVAFDPLQPVRRIPPGKIREFQAKARMAMRLRIRLSSFTPLANQSISQILKEDPEDLAAAPDITPTMVRQLQNELALLQVALDEKRLQQITLGSLQNT